MTMQVLVNFFRLGLKTAGLLLPYAALSEEEDRFPSKRWTFARISTPPVPGAVSGIAAHPTNLNAIPDTARGKSGAASGRQETNAEASF